jgi:ionotropic glutamate receptor NMDA 3A
MESNETFYDKPMILNEINSFVNLTKEFGNIFNKELIIALVKSFKYRNVDDLITNKINKIKAKCCSGYMIDLLKNLANDLKFEFDLYFSHDKKYGYFTNSTKTWSGAINHVISDVAHMAAGSYSINEDRLEYMDFSVPFLYSGYSLLIKHEIKGADDFFMFMKPFSYLEWACIVLFGFISALSLALLEFNSPFGLNPRGRQRARNYTFGSAISMVISLMFMHTSPAKSPKSWAGNI